MEQKAFDEILSKIDVLNDTLNDVELSAKQARLQLSYLNGLVHGLEELEEL